MKLAHLCQSFKYVSKLPKQKNILYMPSQNNIISTRKISDQSFTYDLEKDKSWEGDYLRKQKKVYENESEDFQSKFESLNHESKEINKLPHLVFTNSNKADKKGLPKQSTNIDPDFERSEVYSILQKISGCNKEKIFKPKIESRERLPKVRLLTDEQVQKERADFDNLAIQKMKMLPVMLVRQPVDSIIERNKELNGYEHSNVVFTDISEDLNDRERYVTIREPDGVLRTATWKERDRVMQVYFPKEDRKVIPPKLFDEDKLPIAIQFSTTLNLLERAEAQFALDSEDFVRVSRFLYKHIYENKSFDELRSTKYFGGMAFYYAKHLSIDNLLLDMMKKKLNEDAINLVQLFALLWPNSATAKSKKRGKELLEIYIKHDSKKKSLSKSKIKQAQ